MADTAVLEVEDSAQEFAQRTPKQIAWTRFRRNKVGVVSAWVAIFFIMGAILAPIIVRLLGLSNTLTYPETLNDYAMPLGRFGGMTLKHPLGVEPGTGRDVLSLLLYGSRISYTVAFITSVSTIGIGMLIGVATGYFQGRVDAIVGRFSDFLLSFPGTFMIIALSLPLVQRVESMGIAKDNAARIVVLIKIGRAHV